MGILQKHTAKLRQQSEEIASLKRLVADLQKRVHFQEGLGTGRAIGSWPPELASQEELVFLEAQSSGAKLLWLNPDTGELEYDEDDEVVGLMACGSDCIFVGCIGLARFVGMIGGVATYMFVCGDSQGVLARITGAPSGNVYPWEQMFAWPGRNPASGSALARDSAGYDPLITQHRVFPPGTAIIVHYDGNGFFFEGGCEPQSEECQ